jgi:hypothetical protein
MLGHVISRETPNLPPPAHTNDVLETLSTLSESHVTFVSPADIANLCESAVLQADVSVRNIITS